MNASRILQKLISGDPLSLAAWFAEPLSKQEAETWLPRIRTALRTAYSNKRRCFNLRLAEMIAHFWLGQDVEMDYRSLLAVADSQHDTARLELCYGQLLITKKLAACWQHLNDGFTAAAHVLQPEEYFTVLQRHECLRDLQLAADACEAVGLEDLMQEAQIIRKLQGRRRRPEYTRSKHNDTID